MQARPEEIDALYEVQKIDLEIKQLSKTFDELPQRKTILDARSKREQIEQKRAKIESLVKDANKQLVRINDEDASLQKKEDGVQAAIEAAGNDYRNAEARTKELNGIFKRRGELAKNREEAESELAKVKQLQAQVESALKDLDSMEARATESFKQEGGKLKADIARDEHKRQLILDGVSDEVADLYDKTSKIFDTVFIGKLENGACGVCRAKIEKGRLIDIYHQAPLATCPSCKRLLIIETTE